MSKGCDQFNWWMIVPSHLLVSIIFLNVRRAKLSSNCELKEKLSGNGKSVKKQIKSWGEVVKLLYCKNSSGWWIQIFQKHLDLAAPASASPVDGTFTSLPCCNSPHLHQEKRDNSKIKSVGWASNDGAAHFNPNVRCCCMSALSTTTTDLKPTVYVAQRRQINL